VVFRGLMDQLLQQHDFLMLPCAPMTTLPEGADHSATRLKILRYTTPASLAGTPAVTLAAKGGGVQLVGARGSDARLLAFAASLGEKVALRQ
jgi:Asp-tRNA(Asn)/Glu-tRNA(Gln) amidotransferase A subunit family amidase